ncbi:heme/hemin ABC transporter substrate-binding protein [Ottowia thiooxydans]|uniref:heme/hemin ABC transporter substrate-binding protein n=1 Tax=Ottowia thiooxydans TaxID=219182 RepID=UPI0004121D2D|nr:ABC transporter substrate-binding protein [Ottowia thiooxydans]
MFSTPSRRQVLGAALAAGLPLAVKAQPAGARLPRLVTINGAITEVVYLLGAEAQLVGTDTTSLFPSAAQKTPKVGYLRQLSAEGVLSLKPDAVIATSDAGPPVVLDQLRSAGVQVELVKSEYTWNDVSSKVQAVGRAGRRETAARELQARLDVEWAQVNRQVAGASRAKPRVLFILSHGPSPQVAGQGTAAEAMIRFAGGVNALSGFQGYRPMTAEAMASAAPDVILSTDQGIEALGGIDKLWQRPELALTPAYRRRALVSQDALLLLGFGPRLPQAVRELHSRFHA